MRPIRRLLSRLVVLVALASPVAAGATDVEASAASPAAEMKARYAGVKTIAASFTQVARNPIYGDETQKGRVVLQRPNRIRWEVEGDGRQFISDGETMWMYTPADKQVIRTRGFNPPPSSAMSLLHSLDRLGEIFTVVEVEGPGRIFDLTPRSDEGVKEVRLELDDTLLLQRLVITDAMGSVTELSFTDVKLDPEVDPTRFTFEVPAGVEVIDA